MRISFLAAFVNTFLISLVLGTNTVHAFVNILSPKSSDVWAKGTNHTIKFIESIGQKSPAPHTITSFESVDRKPSPKYNGWKIELVIIPQACRVPVSVATLFKNFPHQSNGRLYSVNFVVPKTFRQTGHDFRIQFTDVDSFKKGLPNSYTSSPFSITDSLRPISKTKTKTPVKLTSNKIYLKPSTTVKVSPLPTDTMTISTTPLKPAFVRSPRTELYNKCQAASATTPTVTVFQTVYATSTSTFVIAPTSCWVINPEIRPVPRPFA